MYKANMGHIYVDESIHDRGNFITVAMVCADDDLSDLVSDALARHGFEPKKDEFKSSMVMSSNPSAQRLREEIRGLMFGQAKLALAFCSLSERSEIQAHAIRLLESLPDTYLSRGGIIYFDEGIAKASTPLPEGWQAQTNCDSKLVGGIQIADCAAHTVSTIILAELGIVNKQIATHGRYPEPEVELEWALWTDLRYSLATDQPIGGYDDEGWCEPMMLPFGLLISEQCNAEVRRVAEERLSEVWLGCIH
tara:strand:- start:6329 stop:7078 length:750 start_codon:yes stop_codon:yes gene_type:complete